LRENEVELEVEEKKIKERSENWKPLLGFRLNIG